MYKDLGKFLQYNRLFNEIAPGVRDADDAEPATSSAAVLVNLPVILIKWSSAAASFSSGLASFG